jgi:integrase
MKDVGQLFARAHSEFKLINYVGLNGEVAEKSAAYLPLPFWPDGSWCFEVASYLVDGVLKEHSLASRGGTAATYASQLGHIVKFCFFNKISFLEMTDSRFKLFMKGLAEKIVKNGVRQEKRSKRQIYIIGCRTLDFLSATGSDFGRESFVSKSGQIRAEKILTQARNHAGIAVGRPKQHWSHAALPHPSAQRRRHPISDDYIYRLRAAIVTSDSSGFIRARRFLMLRLLENLGCRRIELVDIRVAAIFEAKQLAVQSGSAPFLKLRTFKKRGGPTERKVEVSHADLDACINFIKICRPAKIKQLGSDHGKLFVSETTGAELRANTITQELSILRSIAGIVGKVSPHLFRHRFITNLLVKFIRIERAQRAASGTSGIESLQSVSSFMRELVNINAFKQKVMQYTGHSDEASLNCYVDWAYAKLENFDETVRNVNIQQICDQLAASLDEIEIQTSVLTSEQISDKLLSRIKSALDDLRPLHRDELIKAVE